MKKYPLFIPWLLVCIATVGSLFFAQVNHQDPCKLCWYQRMMLFPLAIILGIAAFRNAYRIIIYILPLTLIGLLVSAYHVYIVKFSKTSAFCAECTIRAVSPSPITLPGLSFGLFIILNAILIWILVKHHHSKKL